MLKISKLLEKYRSVVFVVLFLPVLGLFLSNEFHLEMVPDNPHVQFDIEFEVPARTAREIAEKVIEPSEKVFNGLPGLIGVQSKVNNEQGTITLRFHEHLETNTIYLNIQEKMDRIRLIIPRDVESYNISKVEQVEPADFKLEFDQAQPYSGIQDKLKDKISIITNFTPDFSQTSKIFIYPDPQKLAKNNLSISDLTKALQSLGISTSIGRQNGIMFETGNAFTNIEDLKSSLITARGDRPIPLSNIASIEVTTPKPTKELNLWVDKDRITKKEFKEYLTDKFPQATISRPSLKAILEQSVQPAFLILLCFILQLVVIKVLKLPLKAMLFFAMLGTTVSVHFLFWKGLIFPPLTVVDLHALAITLLIGSIFLAVLYIRIRTYFMPADLIPKPPKTLDQVKLFSLSELMPTFIVLAISLWIISLPFLSTTVNIPSRYISQSLFYLGFPILFAVLTIFPLMSTADFLSKNVEVPKTPLKWFISPKIAKYAMWCLLIFTTMSTVIFNRFNFGVNKTSRAEDNSYALVTNLRGYDDRLVYRTSTLSETDLNELNFEYFQKQKNKTSKVYSFSPSGMRYLGDLDLMGFSNAVKDLQKEKHFGFLKDSSQKIPLHFSADLIGNMDIPSLLFADSSPKQIPKALHTIANVNLETMPTTIYRDNLENGDRIVMQKSKSRGSFKHPDNQNIKPTPWTGYLLDQFSQFQKFHLISLIFIFFTFAIYLNSFVRSSLVLIFALSTAGFIFLFREIFPWAFHADCLWLLYLPTFIGLFQILVLTRVIDIERTRGYDRDDCIKEIKKSMAPAVYLCSWTVAVCLFIAGATELFPIMPTLGFWREGIFIAISTGIILWVSNHVLFPLFYLTSEEVVNSIAMRAYKVLVLRRKRSSKS